MVFSTHRGHGHALAKGVPPRALVAELFGRATGCSRGRGGSMHLFAPEVGMMGTSGIVGPCILQAAGAGYSFKLLKTDRVAVAFFGDGAVNNGAFHEGLNLASIWKLPVLFVCENNQFATEVPFQYAAGNPERRRPRRGLRHARRRGRRQRRPGRLRGRAARPSRAPGAATAPTLIECKTYRTRPHAEGMGDFTYRTREEVEGWKTRCPIQRLRRLLVEDGLADEAELDAIDEEVEAQIVEAIAVRRGEPLARPGDGRRPRLRRAVATAGREVPSATTAAAGGARADLHEGDARGPRRGDGQRTRGSSCWARGSASAAATSPRRPACSTATARSGSATRRSASAASSAWPAARR